MPQPGNISDDLETTIADGRATRPSAVEELRAAPRFSIAELNNLDHDQLMERLQTTKYDTRGPVTKFLDLIDAPRNAIANFASSAAAKKAYEAGNVGAFGQPKVVFSDLLGEMGMSPGLTRSVLGFAGDIATDPLTYVGPGAVKNIGVQVGRRGSKVLKTAIKSVGKGEEIANPIARELHQAVTALHPVEEGADAGSHFASKIYGEIDPKKPKSGPILGDYYDRPTNTATMVDDDLVKVDAEFAQARDAGDTAAMALRRLELAKHDRLAAASKSFVAEHGYGGKFKNVEGTAIKDRAVRYEPGQGLLFGNAGSQIAHIPLTEYGIYVPAFTPPAKAAVAARATAFVKEGKIPQAANLIKSWGVLSKGPQVMRDLEKANAELDNTRSLRSLGEESGWGVTDAHVDRAHAIDEIRNGPVEVVDLDKMSDADVMTVRDEIRGMNQAPGAGDTLDQALVQGEREAVRGRLMADAKAAHDEAVLASMAKRDKILSDYSTQVRQHIADYQSMLDNIDANKVKDLGELQSAQMMHEAIVAQHGLVQTNMQADPFFQMMYKRLPNGRIQRSELYATHPYKAYRDDARKAAEGVAEGSDEVRAFDEHLKAVDPNSPEAAALLQQRAETKAKVAAEFIAKNYDERHRAITAMADEDVERSLSMADAMHSYTDALHDFADKTRGTIQGAVSRDFDILSESAKHMLGVDDAVLGSSFFASLERAARGVLSDNSAAEKLLAHADRELRTTFRNSLSGVNGLAAEYLAMKSGGAVERANTELSNFDLATKNLMIEHEIPDNKANDLMSYIYAKAVQRHPDKGEFDLLNLDGTPGQILQSLERLGAAGGVFDKPEIVKGIEELADQYNSINKEMGAAERAAGIAKNDRKGYVPNVLNPEFKPLVDANKQSGGLEKSGIGKFKEGFQTHKQLDRYRFTAPDGTRKEFYEADRHLMEYFNGFDAEGNMKFTDKFMQNYGPTSPFPDVGKFIANKIQTILDHETVYKDVYEAAKGKEGMVQKLLAKPVDAMELNSLASNGMFNYLTGMDPGAMKVFSEDALFQLRSRMAGHDMAIARPDFQDAVRLHFLDLNEAIVKDKGNKVGSSWIMKGGQKATVLPPSGGKSGRVLVGDTVYRKLDVNPTVLSHPDNLASGMLEHLDMAAYLPERLAEQVERVVNAVPPENTGLFLNTVNELNKVWKAYTLFRFAWITGNAIGNIWNMASGGVNLKSFTEHAGDAVKLWKHRHDLDYLKKTFTVVGGRKVSYYDLIERMEQHSLIKSGRAQASVREVYGDYQPGQFSPPAKNIWERPGQFIANEKEAIAQNIKRQQRMSALAEGAKDGDKAARFKAGLSAINDRRYFNRIFSQFAAMNGVVEDVSKIGAYISFLDDGLSAEQAAKRVKDVLFDYSDMTQTEAKLRKYYLPFYAWVRNNGAFQVRTLLQNPKWAAAVPKLKDAIEEAVAGDQAVPDWARPGWMRDEIATQVSTDPAKALTIGSWIPTEPVNRLGGAAVGGWDGIMGLLRFGGSMLAQPIQMPLSLGQGREYYTGRTIAPNMEGDLSPGEFIGSQFGALREILPMGLRTPPLIAAGKEGPGALAARLAAGGRLQGLDTKQLAFQTEREFKTAEDGLRKHIAIAEREGNKEESLAARVRLLALYREKAKTGGKIPKWAAKTLAGESASIH